MRICHVITGLGYGGAERLLCNFTRLHAARHQIDVVYLKGKPDLIGEFAPGIRIHHVPYGLDCPRELRRLLVSTAPDVVHTHLGHADFIGLWASRGLPLRRFCTMHNVWFKWDWRDYAIFGGYRALFALLRDCHVVAISETVAAHVRGRLGVPAARTHVIYNGIPDVQVTEARDSLRRRLGIPAAAFVVLFVGRLRRQKSVATLIDAAAGARRQIPNLLVLVVGEGEEEADLRRRTAAAGLEDVVRFCGVTSRPEEYFHAADLFALPSVFEGLGLVVLEAFRAGLPVVATAIEGPRELIVDGQNGLLVPPSQPTAMARALVRLHQDDGLRARLGGAGHASFADRFSITAYAEALERLYADGAAPVTPT